MIDHREQLRLFEEAVAEMNGARYCCSEERICLQKAGKDIENVHAFVTKGPLRQILYIEKQKKEHAK
jgi:hypothetical protein